MHHLSQTWYSLSRACWKGLCVHPRLAFILQLSSRLDSWVPGVLSLGNKDWVLLTCTACCFHIPVGPCAHLQRLGVLCTGTHPFSVPSQKVWREDRNETHAWKAAHLLPTEAKRLFPCWCQEIFGLSNLLYLVIGQGAMLGFLEAHFVTCWIRGCGGNTCKASLRGDLLALLGRKKQAGQELVSASF